MARKEIDISGESRYLRTSRLARIDSADAAGRQGWRFRAAVGYGLYPTNSALPDFVGSGNLRVYLLILCSSQFSSTSPKYIRLEWTVSG
jgi:hypothetical protein